MASSYTSRRRAMARSGRGRWIGLAMLSIGVAMIIVDATIVNVAIPSIIRDLDLDSTQAEWINTIYALVFAALLITLGPARRRLRPAADVPHRAWSSSSSRPCSPACRRPASVLIFARILQGIGGAMILPATQAILNTNFQGRDRAIAFGIWGSVIGGMAAVGPLLGGFLTTYLSWRWAFFINLPVGLIAVAGTLHYIGESQGPGGPSRLRPARVRADHGRARRRLCSASSKAGNTGGGRPNPRIRSRSLGWTWPFDTFSVIPFILAFGVFALVLFAIVETRRRNAGKFYLFDFTLWRYRGFRYGNLAGTIVSLGEFGLLFALPLFLQGVLGYSAFETGLVFLSLAIGAFVAAPLAATFARRYGPRWVVTTGMVLEAVGILGTPAHLDDADRAHARHPALRVRHRCRLRDGPADEHRALGRAGRAVRHRIRRELDDAPGRLGPRDRDPRDGPLQRAGEPVRDRVRVDPAAGVPPAVAAEIGDFVSTALDASAGQAIGPLRDDPASVTALLTSARGRRS